MSRQVSDSQSISTIEVATSVGFTAGDYVYRYGANLVGFPKAASNSLGDLAVAISGTTYTDYISSGLTGQQISAQGPLIDSTLYSGTTRTITTPLVAAAVINAVTSYTNNVVAALQGGNYVSVYFTAATTLTAAIYDTTGTIVGSAVTISASAVANLNNTNTVAVAGLTDGGYVVAFTGVSSYPQYVRVNSSNAITAGPTTVRSGTAYGTNNNNKSVCGTSSGGFAIAVCSEYTTYQGYVSVYSSGNSLLWQDNIDAGTNYYGSNSGWDSVSIVQNGTYLQIGVVNWDVDPCTGAISISLGLNCWQTTYNARVGTKVSSTSGLGYSSRTYSSKIKVCPIIGSTDAAIFMFSQALAPTTITCTTVVAGVNQNVNFSVNSGVSTESFWPIALASGGFGFVYAGIDSVVKLILATKSSNSYVWTQGSAQTLYNTAAISYTAMCASGGRSGRIFVSFPNSSSYPVNMQVSNYTATNGVTYITGTTNYTPATNYSLLGVALTAATAGSSGIVQTKGTAKLNAGYASLSTPTSFNYSTSTYGPFGGNTGSVSGTTVTLGGL